MTQPKRRPNTRDVSVAELKVLALATKRCARKVKHKRDSQVDA